MVDTVLAMEVFGSASPLAELSISLCCAICANLDAPRTWPLLHFFRQELREASSRMVSVLSQHVAGLGDTFAAQLWYGSPRALVRHCHLSQQHIQPHHP